MSCGFVLGFEKSMNFNLKEICADEEVELVATEFLYSRPKKLEESNAIEHH